MKQLLLPVSWEFRWHLLLITLFLFHFPSLSKANTNRTDLVKNDGTMVNFTKASTLSDSENALNFDGINDYVVTKDNDEGLNVTGFTIETWVKWNPTGALDDVDFICGKGLEQMEIHTGGGSLANGIRFIPTTGVYLDAYNKLLVGVWTHIAVVYKPSESLAKMYINGSEVPLTKATTSPNPINTPVANTETPFYLGMRTGVSMLFQGSMDEFRVWNRVRSQTEIQADLYKSISISSTGLISYYNFNVGIPGGNNTPLTTLLDLTSNNYTGTLTNFALTGSTSNWVEGAPHLPSVTTQNAMDINSTSAIGNGTITLLGSPAPIQYGVCWNTTGTPIISDNKTTQGIASATGAFTSSMTGLNGGTKYYVRAYATNTAGTVYGNEITFTTLTNGTFTGATNNDWATASNWAGGSVPTSSTDVTIPSGKSTIISATTAADCRNLTVETGGSLTIQSSESEPAPASVTGSLIVSGTSTGNVSCQRYMTGNVWHLVSSPVGAQNINTLVVTNVGANAVAKIDPKYGLAPYDNTTPGWEHYTTGTVGAAGNFQAGKGYEILRTGAGIVTFTGIVPTDDVSIAITKNTSGWNLVGNPFPSSIYGNSPAQATNNFLTVNTAAMDANYLALYVWDAANSTYLTVNHTYNSGAAFHVAPGQGFFVYSAAGNRTVNFTEAMQTHQTGNIFKNAVIPNPSIKLIAQRTEGATSTNILYLDTMTTGLDPGYDAGRFSGGANGFAVYTHLVGDNTNSVDFDIQCLPANNWDQVIPIGLNAPENTEVVFRTETMNLPIGVSVLLEDKVTGSFTALSGPGNVYRVKTDTKTQGTGRFFLHTKTSDTGIELPDKKVEFSIIPRPQYNTLRVIGKVGKNTQLEVYDMGGRKMLHKMLNETEVNDVKMDELASGMYVVYINSSTQRVSKKFSWMKN